MIEYSNHGLIRVILRSYIDPGFISLPTNIDQGKVSKEKVFLGWATNFFKRFKMQFLVKLPGQSVILFSKKAQDWMSTSDGEMNAAATEIKMIKPF